MRLKKKIFKNEIYYLFLKILPTNSNEKVK